MYTIVEGAILGDRILEHNITTRKSFSNFAIGVRYGETFRTGKSSALDPDFLKDILYFVAITLTFISENAADKYKLNIWFEPTLAKTSVNLKYFKIFELKYYFWCSQQN